MIQLPIKKYVIVGSYPLNIRYSKDIDVICYKNDVEFQHTVKNEYSGHFLYGGRRIELLFADKQESFQSILEYTTESREAEFWELFAIKAGHIVFPHKSWEKHIADYHILRQITKPGSENWHNHIYDLIKLHRKATKERLGARTPSLLGVTKEKFFDDKVVKYYVHDNIHLSMAHKERPMYEYMQDDPNIVACNKQKWADFSETEKDWTVLEEAYVIALERHIIPTMMGGKIGLKPFEAFKWALYRICTNLTSGWFREYAVENYFRILNKYDKNYIDKFLINIQKYEKVIHGGVRET